MAEVVLSPFLRVVFGKLASGILVGARKIWGADIHRDLRKLESTLSTIQAVLQDAEERQVKDRTLRDWLAKLKDAAYELDDILEEFNHAALRHERGIHGQMIKKVRDFLPSYNSRSFRQKMGHKIREILERLDGIAAERCNFHLRTESGPAMQLGTRDRPETHSFVVKSDVVGREEDKRKIMELLINHDGRKGLPILSILGIGGVGKTTLAQLVYNEKRVAEHFQQRIWVCVADDFDARKLIMAIIETATGEKWDSSFLMDPLQQRLREILSAKNFLLVLDDIWNENPQWWEELKVLLTSSAEGSAIIVTTRSETVSSIVSTLEVYRLSYLSEDDCWILFKSRAFIAGIEEPQNLVTIGKTIVKKCGGLPLAAKTLGSLLRYKREEWEWRIVMESEIWELPNPNDGILPSLRLSYNQLPFHVKQCFAYCAIFPKDYDIDRDMLIQLWIANDFLPSDSVVELELKGHQVFYELASRSLFQDYKEVWDLKEGYMKRTCRMHDLIHNLTRSLMANEFCILDKPGSISNSKIRHLSVTNDDADLSTILNTYKTMRTLMVFTRQSYKAKFSHINHPESYLRVLSLYGNDITKIPVSLSHMKHLRYLDLSYTNISALPEATCSLLYLQTLKLTGCRYLCKLPSDIRHMSRLRHLYLYGCYDLHRMPKGIGQLRHLRTLTAYAVGNKSGSGSIGELKDLNIGGMLHLYGLRNVRNASDAEVANLGSKHDLQCLKLDWRDSEDEQIMTVGNAEEVLGALQLPQNLKTCTIHSYTGAGFRLNSQQIGQIPFLEVLEIKNMVYVKNLGGSEFYGSVGDQVSTVFPVLRELEIQGMDNLEEWSGVEGRPSFPHLRHLNISRCPKLTSIPSLPSVKDLVLDDCPLLLPSKGFFGHMQSLNRLVMLRCEKLTLLLEQDEDESRTSSIWELIIVGCNQLMLSSSSLGLWKNFSSLQYLHIERCDGLKSLPVEMIKGLSSLKRLYIDSCQNLTGSSSLSAAAGAVGGLQLQYLIVLEEVEIRYCEKLDNFAHDSLQQLTTLKRLALVRCEQMTALPEFPKSLLDVVIDGCHNISSLPERLGCLTTLASLKLYTLPNLCSLPGGMDGLQALEDLTIWDCPKLISLPIGLQQRLASLRCLRINFCAGLQSRCETGGEYWPLISCIPKKEIGVVGEELDEPSRYAVVI